MAGSSFLPLSTSQSVSQSVNGPKASLVSANGPSYGGNVTSLGWLASSLFLSSSSSSFWPWQPSIHQSVLVPACQSDGGGGGGGGGGCGREGGGRERERGSAGGGGGGRPCLWISIHHCHSQTLLSLSLSLSLDPFVRSSYQLAPSTFPS